MKESFILQAPSKHSCVWDQLGHLLRIFSRRWCLSATPRGIWGRPSSPFLLDPDPLRVFLTKWGEGRNTFLHPQQLSQSSHTKVWPERMVGVCTSISTIKRIMKSQKFAQDFEGHLSYEFWRAWKVNRLLLRRGETLGCCGKFHVCIYLWRVH